MSRPSVLLMFGAAAALLLALVLLWQSTRSDAVPLSPPTHTPAIAAPAETAAPPAPTPIPPARPAAPPTRSAAPSAPPPRLGVSSNAPVDAPGPTGEGASNENLQYGMDQLKTQTLAIEPKVRECVDKAAITGAKVSGVALLTYMVAIHGDKITVDETGFDSEKTTLKNESLVQCLHETSKAMTFEGLPRNAKEIWVSRQVTLENGKLVENKHVSFSYNPYVPK